MSRSTFLLAMPSFGRGLGSVLDVAAAAPLFNLSDTPEQADCDAMARDWQAVGDDLMEAARRWAADHGVVEA